MGKHSVIVLWKKRLSEGLGLPVSHGTESNLRMCKGKALYESNLVSTCETVSRAYSGCKVVAPNPAFSWPMGRFADTDTVLVLEAVNNKLRKCLNCRTTCLKMWTEIDWDRKLTESLLWLVWSALPEFSQSSLVLHIDDKISHKRLSRAGPATLNRRTTLPGGMPLFICPFIGLPRRSLLRLSSMWAYVTQKYTSTCLGQVLLLVLLLLGFKL